MTDDEFVDFAAHAAEVVFGYLDWCRERGLPYEQTQDMETAREYGRYAKAEGVNVSYFELLLMAGRAREAFYG